MDFVGKKLISGIVAYGTFEINHGWPWFISNVYIRIYIYIYTRIYI